MGFLEATAKFFGMTLIERPPVVLSSPIEDELAALRLRRSSPRLGAWRVPTVAEALGVPAIHRAVSLISSTTGMLSVEGFRNGEVMSDPPRLIVRPDPYETPAAFYGMTAANKGKYGEFVWWIAAVDGDGLAQSLINIPLHELQVEDNPDNRLLPRYRWGTITGTRYSGANPSGRFVHVKDPLSEPFALRGDGPLQRAKAATSIATESQRWAANFYTGGFPRDVVKWADFLDGTLKDEMGNPDPDNGVSEADRLRAQYTARDDNTPIVVDQRIESITTQQVNPQGAQMLEARSHQTGDAARMFGIPGSLLEYQQPGASLTYQNLEGEFTKFVKTCLQPLYLEPIEQALSDLLTRSTVARFNVAGFLRADIKTRFEVHGIAIDKGIYDPAYAQRQEGIAPGDVEFAPVPFQPSGAVPAPITRSASAVMRDVRCDKCGRLLVKAEGAVEVPCRHCKTLVAA